MCLCIYIYIYILFFFFFFSLKKKPKTGPNQSLVFSLKKYCSVKSITLSSLPGKFKCSAPEWFSGPEGITPDSGLIGLNNTIYICIECVYICLYMYVHIDVCDLRGVHTKIHICAYIYIYIFLIVIESSNLFLWFYIFSELKFNCWQGC